MKLVLTAFKGSGEPRLTLDLAGLHSLEEILCIGGGSHCGISLPSLVLVRIAVITNATNNKAREMIGEPGCFHLKTQDSFACHGVSEECVLHQRVSRSDSAVMNGRVILIFFSCKSADNVGWVCLTQSLAGSFVLVIRVYELRGVEDIDFGTTELFLESGILLENLVYCIADLVSSSSIPAYQKSCCGKHCWWWLIEVACGLDIMVLDFFPVVVLVHAASAVFGAADDDIAQRISFSGVGAPPPNPTISPIFRFGKLWTISLATVAAVVVPYSP
jgi:hypothetical protein